MTINITQPAMTGLTLIGLAMQFSSKPEAAMPVVANLLHGSYDHELRCATVYQKKGIFMVVEEELVSPEITEHVNRIKGYFRSEIQSIFRQAAYQVQAEKDLALRNLKLQLLNTARPHEQGTVAELAARLGISKSEVRRRKTDGTLDQLIAERAQND